MDEQKKNKHAVALGKLGGTKGGKSTSDKKRLSSARNGKMGGRPKGVRGHESKDGSCPEKDT